MARIHTTAIVEKNCELADDVEVGAYTIIREGTIIGSRTVVDAHVLLEHTTVGADCRIHFGAAIGGPPQDQTYQGEPTRVLIGERNVIREYVTIHRATGEGNVTRVGDDNMLMASTHLGHNCEVGNSVTLSTLSGMSGHTIIEDRVIIGGMVLLHGTLSVDNLGTEVVLEQPMDFTEDSIEYRRLWSYVNVPQTKEACENYVLELEQKVCLDKYDKLAPSYYPELFEDD